MPRIFLMLCGCLLLSACHSDSNSAVWRYQCTSGSEAEVRYDTEKATLEYQGETHILEQVISASGARYRNQSLEWWSKGNEATLFTDDNGNAGDVLDHCNAIQ